MSQISLLTGSKKNKKQNKTKKKNNKQQQQKNSTPPPPILTSPQTVEIFKVLELVWFTWSSYRSWR